MPKQFSGDLWRLQTLLKAVLDGSRVFSKSPPLLSVTLKEQNAEFNVVQFSIRTAKSLVQTDTYMTAADYLATFQDRADATSGIGLAEILIQQLGGQVLIRSEKTGSRTINLIIPLRIAGTNLDTGKTEAFNEALPASSPDTTKLTQLRILVAEDNQLEQIKLKKILDNIGCQTVIVNDGKEAVDESDYGDYDLILMDILMPVMDGFEATRLIRERERLTNKNTPVVALTSYSLKAIQEKSASVGMNDYLAKPVSKNELVSLLIKYANPETNTSTLELDQFPVLDISPVLETLDSDLDTYRELVSMYFENYAGNADTLAEKLTDAELDELVALAHALKGVAAGIGGLRLAEVARQVQDICRQGIRPEQNLYAQQLKAAAAEFKAALESINWNELV